MSDRIWSHSTALVQRCPPVREPSNGQGCSCVERPHTLAVRKRIDCIGAFRVLVFGGREPSNPHRYPCGTVALCRYDHVPTHGAKTVTNKRIAHKYKTSPDGVNELESQWQPKRPQDSNPGSHFLIYQSRKAEPRTRHPQTCSSGATVYGSTHEPLSKAFTDNTCSG